MSDLKEIFGGTTRNRTGVIGFAIRCVATPPWCLVKTRDIGQGARGDNGFFQTLQVIWFKSASGGAAEYYPCSGVNHLKSCARAAIEQPNRAPIRP